MTQALAPPRPTDEGARFDSLDLLRGVAVLGILLMNIVGFGLPGAGAEPLACGGDEGADLAAWALTTVLFEGTMRGLFTLLFGAGVVLFCARAAQAGPARAADLHVRRMLWLVAFGFVNSHLLLWEGDILFEYGVVGLVLYAFRHAPPRKLGVAAIVLFAFLAGRGALEAQGLEVLRGEAGAARALAAGGAALTAAQQAALDTWDEARGATGTSQSGLQAQVGAMQGGFVAAWSMVTERVQHRRTTFFLEYGFVEDLATMLLGIALFGCGALQGRWSARQYAALALAGHACGLAIKAAGALAMYRSGFDPVVTAWAMDAAYEPGRIPAMLGHLGLVLLAWKRGWAAGLLRRLAAVGRMAFTNYLAQSAIGLLVFTGVGLGLFGELRRHQLYYVVAATWALQLAWSPWWLARFHHGPLEWLWRSLTYARLQPLRRAAGSEAAAAAR
jgi:uncharacterized protein